MQEQPNAGPPPRMHNTDGSATRTNPSSSRMLETYLADLERLLDERRWDLALRDAFDLPSIAVALSDSRLQSSAERCREWCARWIHPTDVLADSAAAQEQLGRMLHERKSAPSPNQTAGVPSHALRRLRLRRHARNSPRGFKPARPGADEREAVNALDICTAVVDGVRRWYAHCACHDAIAQANLARLAVLR